ncbi:unnamed protein product [Chrysoparadoxa australica]
MRCFLLLLGFHWLSLCTSLVSLSKGPVKASTRVPLGESLKISPMGLGSWQLGNRVLWQYEEGMDDEWMNAFDICVKAGINFFDTADSYGNGDLAGQSEMLLGRFANRSKRSKDIVIASKFAPYPTRIGRGSMYKAALETTERLGRPLQVGQLHWRPPLGWQEEAYWDDLIRLKQEGKIKEIGLSNYGPVQLAKAHKYLKERGVQLASNQVQFSLLSRLPLDSGLLELSEELGVRTIAYSPLSLGLLSGKYRPEASSSSSPLPQGLRGFVFSQVLPTTKPLFGEMESIAKARGKAMSQVAINWTLCKGGLPIVGVKSPQMATENLGALGWALSPAEVDVLDAAARKAKQATQNIFMSN